MRYQRENRQRTTLFSKHKFQYHVKVALLAALIYFSIFPFWASLIHESDGATKAGGTTFDYTDVPWQYGEVIYRINPESNKQLYIIGVSHRAASSGENGPTTVAAQKEIYRIGEWLKKSVQLNLLLPEGYLNEASCSGAFAHSGVTVDDPMGLEIDADALEEELTAETFTNAEMLLIKHLNFRACQVENSTVYGAVRNSLDSLLNGGKDFDFRLALEEIQYLQEVRTAQLLQDIPEIIEHQYDYGGIDKCSALFTIGLNHIKHIFRYFEDSGVDVTPLLTAGAKRVRHHAALNLLEDGYGVCIILPRSIADNTQLLKQTKVDHIHLAQDKG